MNEAQELIAKLQQPPDPTGADIIEMAGDILGAVCLSVDTPVDFDGAEITILRDQETGSLKALIISPVDMQGDEPFARWQINPDAIEKPKAPKLVMAG